MNIWRIAFWNHSAISAFNFITTFVNCPSSWAQYFPNAKRMNYAIAKSTHFYSICHRQSVKKRLSAFLKYKMTDYFSDIPKVNPRRGWNFISLFVTTIRVVPSPPPFSDTPLIVFNATLSNVSFVLPKGR